MASPSRNEGTIQGLLVINLQDCALCCSLQPLNICTHAMQLHLDAMCAETANSEHYRGCRSFLSVMH